MPNLMFCPDCGKEISRRAQTCIHCGCPISEILREIPSQTKTPSKTHNPINQPMFKHIEAKPDFTGRLKLVGWISAFLVPIVGLIIGLIMLTKKQNVSGISQIVISVAMMFVYFTYNLFEDSVILYWVDFY